MSNLNPQVAIFYVLTAAWCSVESLISWHAGLVFISRIAIGMPATFWLIQDSAKRGASVPHIVQPWVLAAWWIVVPVYVISTRKRRGFWQVVRHAVATIVVAMVFAPASAWLVEFWRNTN